MTPREVKACSMWEFTAAVDGWIAAHTAGDENDASSLSEAERDALWEVVQEKQGIVH